MSHPVKFLVAVVVLFLAAVPAAAIATFLLYPLWSWIEATYGIESVGHSGPADWCFMLVYGIVIVSLLPLLWRRWRRRSPGSKLR
jgi:hypothetical protein